MLKNKYIFLFLVSLFVFSSFTYIHPMLKSVPVAEKEYSINTAEMNIRNRPPLFKLKDKGVYFIHPASVKQAKATFIFDNKEKQLWYFSIQKGSPAGKILFIVKKNDDEINKFIVDTKHDAKIDINVNKNDKITVIADCAGTVAGDWGNLKIYKYEPHYILKLRILALVWVLFILYLIHKGYIFISISSYFGFMLTVIAEKMNYGALEYASICTYTAIFFLVGFISIFLYQDLARFKRFKIATFIVWILKIAIFSIPIIFIQFYLVFNKSVDWNILFAIYQTNSAEAIGFIESFVPSYYIFIFLLFLVFIGYILFHQEKKERELIERSILMIMIIVLIGFISLNIFNARILNLIDSSYMEYNSQIERIKSFQNKRKTSKIKFSAIKKEKDGELYVVVIGESLNKYNMGIYGHFRNTTPMQMEQVKKDNLLVFTKAYSNSGNTEQTLSLALTEANQYNNKNFLESLSFIDIFNKAKFNTVWISTHSKLNETNTIVSALALSSKKIIDLGETFNEKLGLETYYDENVIKRLKENISRNRNTLIVIHIYGNHYKYSDRYPAKYSKYKKATPYMIGSSSSEKILHHYSDYDNSVYYNDYVVSSILNVVKNYKGVSSFIYLSDHGEDVITHAGHTARAESFNFTMSQIPLTIWVSPEYKKRYSNTYKSLISHKNTLFSNDMLYESIIGLAHIETDRYNSKYDLSSQNYELKAKDALILHGYTHYTTIDNLYYWRQYNTSLLDEGIRDKIVINNINTVGKLNEAWLLGYRSFRINLKYLQDDKKFIIDTKKYNSKGALIELLSYFKIDKIKKLILNFNNLENNNINDIIQKLEDINKRLDIKDKIVIIVQKYKLARLLKSKGWHIAIDNKSIKENEVDYSIMKGSDIQLFGNSSKKIIDNAFELADIRLNNKLKSMEYLKNDSVEFVIVNMKSQYDWKEIKRY